MIPTLLLEQIPKIFLKLLTHLLFHSSKSSASTPTETTAMAHWTKAFGNRGLRSRVTQDPFDFGCSILGLFRSILVLLALLGDLSLRLKQLAQVIHGVLSRYWSLDCGFSGGDVTLEKHLIQSGMTKASSHFDRLAVFAFVVVFEPTVVKCKGS